MNKKEALSLGIFLVGIFLIGFLFFSSLNTQVTIQLDSGKTITSKIPATFSLINTVFLMLLTAISTFSFVYYITDLSKKITLNKKQRLTTQMLEGDEKALYLFVLEKGECLQKDLIYELGFPKAKVTRILDRLEKKNILTRISYGKTNKVVAKE